MQSVRSALVCLMVTLMLATVVIADDEFDAALSDTHRLKQTLGTLLMSSREYKLANDAPAAGLPFIAMMDANQVCSSFCFFVLRIFHPLNNESM